MTHTRFTLLRALLDRAHPGRREYERFRATPEEAAEAVQAARVKLGATVQAEVKLGENPAGQCGPECAEGHMYAYRCALKPPPLSPWKILGAWQAAPAPAPTRPDLRERYADALRTTPSTGNTHKPGAVVEGAAKPGGNPAARCSCGHAASMHTGRERFCAVPRCECASLQQADHRFMLTGEVQPPARSDLRQRYADAIRAKVDGSEGCANEYRLADAVLAVRDAELEDMCQRLATQAVAAHDVIVKLGNAEAELTRRDAAESTDAAAGSYAGRAEQAEAALDRVCGLHQPDPNVRAGWKSDDDPATYGRIARACTQCGSPDLAVRWPCPTIRTLDSHDPTELGTGPANPNQTGPPVGTTPASDRPLPVDQIADAHVADHDDGPEAASWYCGAFSSPMPLHPMRCTRPAGHDGHHSDGHGGRWAPASEKPEADR